MASTEEINGIPYDPGSPGSAVYQDRWRLMTPAFARDGIMNLVGGEFEPYADSSGMQVKVKTGAAWVKSQFAYELNEEKILTVSPAHATLNRIDSIVIENNFSDRLMYVRVIAGEADVDPEPPAIQDDEIASQMVLAHLLVEAAAVTIEANKITDLRILGNGHLEPRTQTRSGVALAVIDVTKLDVFFAKDLIENIEVVLSGAAAHEQKIMIVFHDDGTPVEITWPENVFPTTSCGGELPVETIGGVPTRAGLIYNALDDVWEIWAFGSRVVE